MRIFPKDGVAPRVWWRRRPVGGLALRRYQENRRRDAGATKSCKAAWGYTSKNANCGEKLGLGDCGLLVRGGKLTEPLDHGGNRFEREGDFLFGRLVTEAQAQRGARVFRSEAERH